MSAPTALSIDTVTCGEHLAELVACPENRMCDVCIFRKGSWPNRGAQDVHTAVRAIREGNLFGCVHRGNPRLILPPCRGFTHAVLKRRLGPPENLAAVREAIRRYNRASPTSMRTMASLKTSSTPEHFEQLYARPSCSAQTATP